MDTSFWKWLAILLCLVLAIGTIDIMVFWALVKQWAAPDVSPGQHSEVFSADRIVIKTIFNRYEGPCFHFSTGPLDDTADP